MWPWLLALKHLVSFAMMEAAAWRRARAAWDRIPCGIILQTVNAFWD
jgi:hypothetical protein